MELEQLHERLLFIEDQMHAGLMNDAKKRLAQLIKEVGAEKKAPPMGELRTFEHLPEGPELPLIGPVLSAALVKHLRGVENVYDNYPPDAPNGSLALVELIELVEERTYKPDPNDANMAFKLTQG